MEKHTKRASSLRQFVDVGPDLALFKVLEQEQLFDGQQHKVVQAPADEVPVGAVPDAGEQLHHEQVEDLAFCVDELEKRGMESWLYDEDRWPSGTCGGTVAKKKANRLKSIVRICISISISAHC